jgi:geranylgeranyl pyrophosphate synthase
MTEVALGPYPFTEQDLAPDRLAAGIEHTLSDFYQWRDANPNVIAAHIDHHTAELAATTAQYSPGARLGRFLSPERQAQFDSDTLRAEIGFFCVYNLAEVPTDVDVERFRREVVGKQLDMHALLAGRKAMQGVDAIIGAIETHLPSLRDAPELSWLREQYQRLYRILPDDVLNEGGMGKAARTTAGVLAIGAFDTMDTDHDTRRSHMRRILPAAFAYGALYPIIDDTLQDNRQYLSESDKRRYHDQILQGIRTGQPVDPRNMPDHPLAEELVRIHDILLSTFPRREYPHLYTAGESMYLAQDRDARLTAEQVATRGIAAAIYPDVFAKAAMTRVVANIIGRRSVPIDYYTRSININFINQLRDDLHDRDRDERAGRITPFTYTHEPSDTNPLYDMFAYSAYIAERIFNGDPEVRHILTNFGANRVAAHIRINPNLVADLDQRYGLTPEIARFIAAASRMPRRMAAETQRQDIRLQKAVGDLFSRRPSAEAEPRTFVSDRLGYINEVIDSATRRSDGDGIRRIVEYALEAGGKRLRPALTLMLADSLGIEYRRIEPVLVAVELYHTSSLLFDDLPAQDNASLRRNRPTAHIAFDEAGAQLAGIAMVSEGFGALAQLRNHFDGDAVAEVIQYFGTVLGPERLCRGQYQDLSMERKQGSVTADAIIEMYSLKTSPMIEAALVPLMILERRPQAEIEHVQAFAHHAGIVYQLRDDILDMTSDTASLGKDADGDGSKVNIARSYGIDEAERLMQHHLAAAGQHLAALPFNTNLLSGIVNYFANRAK